MCKAVKKKSLDERRSNCSCACANHFYVRNDQKRRCTEAVRIPLLSPTHILKDLVEDCPNDWQLPWMSYSNLPFNISFLFLLFLISPPSFFFLCLCSIFLLWYFRVSCLDIGLLVFLALLFSCQLMSGYSTSVTSTRQFSIYCRGIGN